MVFKGNYLFYSSVLQQFNTLVGKASYLVAHNMSFDEKIVGSEFLRNGTQNTIPSKKKYSIIA
jgi:DNA polymerase-3 subunit epsilon